jgi:hypothetical protein
LPPLRTLTSSLPNAAPRPDIYLRNRENLDVRAKMTRGRQGLRIKLAEKLRTERSIDCYCISCDTKWALSPAVRAELNRATDSTE